MTPFLRTLLLAIGLGIPVVPGLAADARTKPSDTLETAVAASLERARQELARLETWVADAKLLSQDAARWGEALTAHREAQLPLVPALMEIGPEAWTQARNAGSGEPFSKVLENWQRALDEAVRKRILDAGDVRSFQDALKQAQHEAVAFERAAPARPAKADWDKRRDRLMAAVQAYNQALGKLQGVHAEFLWRLGARLVSADRQMGELRLVITLLAPPATELAAREGRQ